jgi:hypothetical protein
MKNKWLIQFAFFLGQTLFIFFPGLSQNNKFSFKNIHQDSSWLILKKRHEYFVQNIPIKFRRGFELGYGKVFRTYQVESNPGHKVFINRGLINGQCFFLGYEWQLLFKSDIASLLGFVADYQIFHYSFYNPVPGMSVKIKENYAFLNCPVVLSKGIPMKKFMLSPEGGILMSLPLVFGYSLTQTDSLNNTYVFDTENIIDRKIYWSILFGIKIGSKNNRLNLGLKYQVGLSRIMDFDHNPTTYSGPQPYYSYHKNILSLSGQYFF